MTRRILAALALCALSGQANAQKLVHQESIKSVPAPVLLETSGLFNSRYAKVGGDMYIAGQPTEKALQELKAAGVTTVVNLRMPQEMNGVGFDEAKLVESLGMTYVHIPMRGATGENAYSPANLKRFADVMKSADGKVLLHCTIAWRASHMWAAYLIQQGVPDEAAVKHARAINLMDEHRMDESGQQPVEMFLGRKVAGIGKP
jgi:uncharacterized protein (TIGR01244 family)